MKTPVYPEYIAVLVRRQKARPSGALDVDALGSLRHRYARRATPSTHVELACDDNGKFVALRVRHLCNQGAYVSTAGVSINTNNFARCLPGMYKITKIDVGVACYFSNTIPIGPYRGAGRPEANYALERAVEEAARLLKMDPVRLRKKNLIPASAMPFKTPINTYDSGDFPGIVDKALGLADYASFAKRKREAAQAQEAARHRRLLHARTCRLACRRKQRRSAFPGGDKLILGCNVQSTGQSHATVFSRLLAHKLGIDAAKIEHNHGDTNLGLTGFASVGSRSAMCAGLGHRHHRRHDAGEGQEDRCRGAGSLEGRHSRIATAPSTVVGTDRRISLFDTAQRAREMGENLDTKDKAEAPLTFPNGCHIAEVEIDPDTGKFEIVDLHGGRRLRQCARPDRGRRPGAGLAGQRARPGPD